MEIDLYTAGGDFVSTVWIPPFDPPPRVVTWGGRTFTLMRHAGLSSMSRWRYEEAFAVVVT